MAVKFEFPFAQTPHVIAFVCTLAVALLFSPVGKLEMERGGMMSYCNKFVHFATFGSWLGVQLWVTFFAGLTMYRHLPRHTFGFIQSKLFPKYFLLGTVLATSTLVTFMVEHPFGEWDRQQTIQAAMLGVVVLSTLSNLLYFTPRNVHIMFEKHRFEKEIQAGEAVGKIEDSKLETLNKNKEYVALSKQFVRVHSLASIANLLSLCAQGVHAIYLTSHIATL